MQPKGLLKFLRLEGFVQNVIEYVENRVAIAKLEAKQKVADAVTAMIAIVPAALFGLFAFLFLNLGLALGLNELLDSLFWGFLIVGVFYLILAGVMFSFRDSVWLKKKIVDGSTKFLKEKPQQQDNKGEEAPAGYHADAVEHKKVVFEDVEEPALPGTANNDRSAAPRTTSTADRPPQVKATSAENGNAVIVTETETTQTEDKRSL